MRGEKELGMLQKLSEWLECQEAGDGHGVEMVAKWDWNSLKVITSSDISQAILCLSCERSSNRDPRCKGTWLSADYPFRLRAEV